MRVFDAPKQWTIDNVSLLICWHLFLTIQRQHCNYLVYLSKPILHQAIYAQWQEQPLVIGNSSQSWQLSWTVSQWHRHLALHFWCDSSQFWDYSRVWIAQSNCSARPICYLSILGRTEGSADLFCSVQISTESGKPRGYGWYTKQRRVSRKYISPTKLSRQAERSPVLWQLYLLS